MPKKYEYVNPDGSIWYFNDWTEDIRNAQNEDAENLKNNPELLQRLKKEQEEKNKLADAKLEELWQKHINKNKK